METENMAKIRQHIPSAPPGRAEKLQQLNHLKAKVFHLYSDLMKLSEAPNAPKKFLAKVNALKKKVSSTEIEVLCLPAESDLSEGKIDASYQELGALFSAMRQIKDLF